MQRSCCLPCCSLRLPPRHKPICSKTGSDFRHYGNPSVGVHPVLREVCNLFHPAVGPPSSRKGQFPPACDCLPRRLRPSHGDCNRRLWSRLCPQPQVSRGTFRVARCQHDFVEYRYFLESTPEPKDWQYLTAENSADDLHAVRNAFKSIYPGKWIATGISKGGQTTLLYRTFYPDDVDISVPYVAPLCYGVEDGRHEPFLRKVSTPEDRKRIEDFQLEVLKRKAALLPRFEKYCNEKDSSSVRPLKRYTTIACWSILLPFGSGELPSAASLPPRPRTMRYLPICSTSVIPTTSLPTVPQPRSSCRPPASWAIMATIRSLSRSIFPSNRARVTCIA